MINTDAFKAWLEAQGFAEQTVHASVVHYLRVDTERGAGLEPADLVSPHRLTHFKRIAAAGDIAPPRIREFVEKVLAAYPKTRGLRGGRKAPRRKKTARSVEDGDWARFTAALAALDTAPARVLEVQSATGLRIGDILRIPGKDLHRGVEKGRLDLTTKGGRERIFQISGSGGEKAWAALALTVPKSAVNVAQGLTGKGGSSDVTSSGAAYQQVRRQLKALEEELGLDPMHTHRLRRTIAVQALRVTQDLPAVREMLGQAPGSHAVDSYLDEARSEHVAELSKKISNTFTRK